jgi:hypothetical protein
VGNIEFGIISMMRNQLKLKIMFSQLGFIIREMFTLGPMAQATPITIMQRCKLSQCANM